jgi:hypothetical protein
MNRIPCLIFFLPFFLILAGLPAQAQSDNDSTIVVMSPKQGFSKFRTGMLDLGVSTYLYEGSLSLPTSMNTFEQNMGRSINVNLHLFRHRIGHRRSPVSMEYGLSFNWSNFEFENNFRIDPNADVFTTFDDGIFYNKNRLKTTFLEMPVQLVFAKKPDSNRYLSLGVYGGMLIDSRQKLKSEVFGKENIRSSFQLNKFRYGLTGHVNMGPVGFYAQYSLVNLFRQDLGPELAPFNLGVTILGF